MRVLLTGAFGNVGTNTIATLLAEGHEVRCFDVPNKANRQAAEAWRDRVELQWGDLRRADDVATAVAGMDAVVHLAAIIPPLSEANPDLAEAVNVGGTRTLLAAMAAQPTPPRLVFTSSVGVYGLCQDQAPPRHADDPMYPADHYARHKVACEGLVRDSGLDWTILRLAAVPPLRTDYVDPMMYEIRLDNRIEFVHTRDVALACARAVACEAARGKTLLIGGGPNCQLTYRQFVGGVLEAMGIGMLPDEAFGPHPFYTDWMDSAEAQSLLNFQQHDFDDFVGELQGLLGWRRWFIAPLRPLIRHWLLSLSPYYASNLGERTRRIELEATA